MTAVIPSTDLLAVGEAMTLLDPVQEGPLENVRSFVPRVAGAEANVLVTASRMGARTVFVSAVGADPFGRFVRRTLDEQGVDTSRMVTIADRPTGVFFKERLPDGHRRVYYYRDDSAAANLNWSHFRAADLPTPTVFVASGLSLGLGRPQGMSDVVEQMLVTMAERGSTIVFDANIRSQLWSDDTARADFARLRGYVDVLLAGEDELAVLMPPGGAAAAAELVSSGMRAVFIKAGGEGATLHQAAGSTPLPPFPLQRVVDTVGAGDAFAAGVVIGILNDWDMTCSGQLGARLGAAAVGATGDWEAIPAAASPTDLHAEYVAAAGTAEQCGPIPEISAP